MTGVLGAIGQVASRLKNKVSEVVLVISRRSKFEVIADILRFGQTSRTKILNGSSISSDLLDRYLSLLTGRGFLGIIRKGNHKIYHTTKEGETLVHRIDDIYRSLGK